MSDILAIMSDPVVVTEIGIGSEHPPGFVWSRPQGLGQWMFVYLPVATAILDADGRAICRPGDCLLLDPRFPHWHVAGEGTIRNDWFWAQGEAVGTWAQAYGLPRNRRFHPASTEAVPRLLAEVIRERLRQAPFWQRRVRMLIESLFLELGRQLASGAVSADERLRDVRAQVHARLDERWTVAAMARLCGLGPDRFATCYRRLFAVPPLDDLLRARLAHACVLLAQRGGDVAGAARASGFRDVSWFSRCFRAKFGCPPGAYGSGEADVK